MLLLNVDTQQNSSCLPSHMFIMKQDEEGLYCASSKATEQNHSVEDQIQACKVRAS